MYSLNTIRKNQKIYVLYYMNGKKAYFSTGVKVEDSFWDSKNKKLKKNFSSHQEAQAVINRLLAKIEQVVLNRKALGEDIEVNTIRDICSNNTPKVTLHQFINSSINERLSINKTAKAANLKKVKDKLCEYEAHHKTTLDFKQMDINFYYSFYSYFVEKGYSDNYFGSIIQNLKTLLNDALRRGVTTYDGFKNPAFKVVEKESDAVYLSEQELEQLFTLELTGTLDTCRKVFIIGAFCGLRYSDLKLITATSFATGSLRYRQQKTGRLVTVPLHPYVKHYLDSGLPKVGDLSTFNKRIKKVCKLAKISSKVTITNYVGGERKETIYNKWELVKSHTMRRSFATNLHIRGSPSKIIMELTGHTTLKSFEKYLKCTIKDDRSNISNLWN